jgi:hypothetical protein
MNRNKPTDFELSSSDFIIETIDWNDGLVGLLGLGSLISEQLELSVGIVVSTDSCIFGSS